jgi:hypothetical protein
MNGMNQRHPEASPRGWLANCFIMRDGCVMQPPDSGAGLRIARPHNPDMTPKRQENPA